MVQTLISTSACFLWRLRAFEMKFLKTEKTKRKGKEERLLFLLASYQLRQIRYARNASPVLGGEVWRLKGMSMDWNSLQHLGLFSDMEFFGPSWLACISYHPFPIWLTWWLSGKESACSVGDVSSIPGLGRSPEGRRGNTLQYSCLKNSMPRGA